jgi:hypothetical protein
MGVAYPGSTLTALGSASKGEEGLAAASLQVSETVGVAMGTGATGALLAVAVHLERGMSDGLAWGFVLAVATILVALAPGARLAPNLQWATRLRPKPGPNHPSATPIPRDV